MKKQVKNQLKKKEKKQVKEQGNLLLIIKEGELIIINMINNININQRNKKHLIS